MRPTGETYLIVGLGNPGPSYARNRHNVGFRCLQRLARVHGLEFQSGRRARLAQGTVRGRTIILARPRTFMNESGKAVRPLVDSRGIPLDRLLVVHDDMDLPLGTLRLRPKGGSAGHRGVQSIIDALGSDAFPRLRIGIGRPPEDVDPADYVLQDFTAEEAAVLEEVLSRAVAAIEVWLSDGIATAMDRFNQRPQAGDARCASRTDQGHP